VLRAAGAISGVKLPVRIDTKGVPVYLYTPRDEAEPQAIEQLIRLAESPIPVGHVSGMPDIHMGKGVAIGAVFASEKYICPRAVGADIGCGMCAVPVNALFRDDCSPDQLKMLQKLIKLRIPTSFDNHLHELDWASRTLKDISDECPPTPYLESMIHKQTRLQLGTLGGGNHFIELVYSEGDEQVWCMLHSGSRGIGNKTADHYDSLAFERGTQLSAPTGGDAERINFMEIRSQEGQDYLKDMTWCQAYARENRASMLRILIDCVEEVSGKQADMSRVVNAHHNFCQCETCSWVDKDGKRQERKLWVTRKGATSARPGEYGIIPGSMGVGSYIVKGKGSATAWQSCSHGAGRAMSRTKARQTIALEDFRQSMVGIVCDTDEAVLDEAPQAYKDLTKVLQNQADLVDVQHRLLPLLNVKGFVEKSQQRDIRTLPDKLADKVSKRLHRMPRSAGTSRVRPAVNPYKKAP